MVRKDQLPQDEMRVGASLSGKVHLLGISIFFSVD